MRASRAMLRRHPDARRRSIKYSVPGTPPEFRTRGCGESRAFSAAQVTGRAIAASQGREITKRLPNIVKMRLECDPN